MNTKLTAYLIFTLILAYSASAVVSHQASQVIAGSFQSGTYTFPSGNVILSSGKLNASSDVCITGGNCLSTRGAGTVTGTGAANRAAFWTGASVLSYDGNFTWDNSNKRLGIGTASPATAFEVNGISTFDDYIKINNAAPQIQMIESDNSNNYYNFVVDNGGFSLRYNSGWPPLLNSDSSGNFYLAGKVGIGDTSPGEELDVAGDINATGDICITGGNCLSSVGGGVTGTGAANKVAFWTGASTIDDNVNFTWDNSNQRLGIGTASPGSKLHVVGSITGGPVGGGEGGEIQLQNIAGSAGLGVLDVDSADALRVWTTSTSGGGLHIGSLLGGGGPIMFTTNASEKVRISANGNVGMGISTPAQTLEISNGGNYQLRLGIGASVASFTYDIGRDPNTGFLDFHGYQSSFTGYEFGGVDGIRMSIIANGNVGIGTAAPTSKLHVNGTITIGTGTGTYQAGVMGYTDSNWGMLFRPPRVGSNAAFDFRNYNGDDLFYIREDGVAAFEHGYLYVSADDTHSALILNQQNSSLNLDVNFNDATSTRWVQSVRTSDSSDDLWFYNAGRAATDLMIDNPTGNVGIGTTSPNGKLDVAGDIHMTGTRTKIYYRGDSDSHIGGLGLYSPDAGTTLIMTPYNSTGGNIGNSVIRLGGMGSFDSSNVSLEVSGKVGIGLASPLYKLHVVDTTTDGIAIVGNNTGGGSSNYGVFGQSAVMGVGGKGSIGVSAEGVAYGVYSTSSAADSVAVLGISQSSSSAGIGVGGQSSAINGYGVYGYASSSTGTNYGVYGTSVSSSGMGVKAEASSSTGTTYGVYSIVASDSGYSFYGTGGKGAKIASGNLTVTTGKVGIGTDTPQAKLHVIDSGSGTMAIIGNASGSGINYGVYGLSSSTTGRGVFGRAPTYAIMGHATATSGVAYGAYAYSDSTSGYGVLGYASATSGTTYGVFGQSYSSTGHGVYGYNAASGVTRGVTGHVTSTSSGAIGVLGNASGSTTGTTYGVYGVSYGNNPSAGVYGYSPTGGGEGVMGESSGGIGVYGRGLNGGVGVSAYTSGTGGYAIYAQNDGTGGNYGIFGQTASTNGGKAVHGYASGSSGVVYAISGQVTSSTGFSGYFTGGRGVFQVCPSGFTSIDDSSAYARQLGCIQTAEANSGTAITWWNAQEYCFDNYGGRLPSVGEWYLAASNFGLTDETDDYEWTDDMAVNQDRADMIGSGSITALSYDLVGNNHVFRCWLEI